MSPLVTYQLDESVAVVTMDDGKVNVLSLAMLGEINGALDQAIADKAVVLFCGRPGRFSAGFDLPTLTGGGSDGPLMLRRGFELSERMLSFPLPIVIACTGHALAMGAFLLLSADYRIGTGGPYKIGANEVAIGLTMPETAIEICRQRLSPQYLSRAVISAEIFTPEVAVAAGFLDECVEADALIGAAAEKAAQLSTLNMQAHFHTKLRTRGETLTAMKAAIEADDAGFREFIGA